MRDVTVYRCRCCGCRGPKPDRVRHAITCTDRDGVEPVTFEIGDGPAEPLFRPEPR